MAVQINISIVAVMIGVIVAVALLVVLGSVATTFVVMKYIASNQAILDPVNYEIRWNYAEKSDGILYKFLIAALEFYPQNEQMTFLTLDPSDGNQLKAFTVRRRGKNQSFAKLAEYTFAESPREVALNLKRSEVLEVVP